MSPCVYISADAAAMARRPATAVLANGQLRLFGWRFADAKRKKHVSRHRSELTVP